MMDDWRILTMPDNFIGFSERNVYEKEFAGTKNTNHVTTK
jgi:hypothetical protein